MLYIFKGVNHAIQHNLGSVSNDQNQDRKNFIEHIENIIRTKRIEVIFEEWPDGSRPEVTNTKILLEKLGGKIRYFQIDPPEDQRPHLRKDAKLSIEKSKEVQNWREKQWLNVIKENHKSNSLLVVGNSHVINDFELSGAEKYSLRIPLLKKFCDEKIGIEIVD